MARHVFFLAEVGDVLLRVADGLLHLDLGTREHGCNQLNKKLLSQDKSNKICA